MGGKYRAYPEYRDSGVEMLGVLPSTWKTKQVRYLLKDGAEGIKIGPFGSALKLEDMVDSGVRVFGQENIIKKDFSLGKRRISQNKFEEMRVYQVYFNDLLITMMGTSGKCELVPENIDVGIIDSHLLRLRVKESEILPRFFQLLIDKCYEIECQIQVSGKGSIMHGLNSSIVKSLQLPLPSKEEQEDILDFLSHETAKIDTLIEKQQQLIQLLKEKRQAVISHAVTKGLNPSISMRDSGVEWLGEVPEHWSLPKIKWFFKTESGGTPNTSNFEEYYLDGDIPWIRTTDLNNGDLTETPIAITSKAVKDSACSLLPVNSVLVAMYGGAGSIGKHSLLKFESTINQAVCAILPNGKIDAEFLHLYIEFYRPYWMVGAEGTRKDPNINQDVIRELVVPCPLENEQKEIVHITKQKLAVIDTIIKKSESNIELMQERCTALISAAVTGKIDVRGWQAPESFSNNQEIDREDAA